MNSIDRLSEIFARFPGIGPRQAKRFVYFLLSRDKGAIDTFVRAVEDLAEEIVQCSECMRYFPSTNHNQTLCSVCSNADRDNSMIMIVPRDVDFEAVEKSGSYKGYYFILGGVVPILEKEPEKRIRMNELRKLIDRRKKDLKEIVLAMNANTEGENTADYLKQNLNVDVPISILGRGLSTGAELEYADPETLKNAFLHRTK
jgi:recombination protein RecR